MSICYKLRHNAPAANPVPTSQYSPIEVDGVFLGAAVQHKLGVLFIAGDVRVREMDQSIWPNLAYAYRSARQLFKSGRAAGSFQAGWHRGKADQNAPQIQRSTAE
jgi:hypothetical protein